MGRWWQSSAAEPRFDLTSAKLAGGRFWGWWGAGAPKFIIYTSFAFACIRALLSQGGRGGGTYLCGPLANYTAWGGNRGGGAGSGTTMGGGQPSRVSMYMCPVANAFSFRCMYMLSFANAFSKTVGLWSFLVGLSKKSACKQPVGGHRRNAFAYGCPDMPILFLQKQEVYGHFGLVYRFSVSGWSTCRIFFANMVGLWVKSAGLCMLLAGLSFFHYFCSLSERGVASPSARVLTSPSISTSAQQFAVRLPALLIARRPARVPARPSARLIAYPPGPSGPPVCPLHASQARPSCCCRSHTSKISSF